jgi:L-ribulose-5-phosphate 3-epimerase
VTGGVDWPQRLGGIGDEAALGIAGQITVHQRLCWRHLELRSVGGVAVGDLPAREITEIAARIAEAGLSVPCLDSRIGSWARPITCPFDGELAELDAMARAASRLGTRYVRVMSYPNDGLPEAAWASETVRRLKLLAARAADQGVVLVHENCSGWAATSAERAGTLLSDVDSPALRVLFDVGNPVAHGYDGPGYLAAVLPWVDHVHIKDAVPATANRSEPVFTAPGEGTARLADCLTTLLDAGYQGVFSIAPHVAVMPHTGRRAEPDVVLQRYLDYAGRLTEWLRETAPGCEVSR